MRNILIICILISGGVLSLIRCGNAEQTYLNTHPEVAYMGIQSCQPCHKKIYDTYIETGMGKSFYRPDRNRIIERFDSSAKVYDKYSGYYYYPFWRKDTLYIKEYNAIGYERIESVDYIVGSGHQTRSYIMERNGYLYELPITWYVKKQLWDLSPGYENGNNTRFDREIGEECMACHTGSFEYVEGSKNRFRKISMGIECEQCHGPGETHIKRIQEGQLIDVGEEIDYSIVNPAKLSTEARFDICQQCHLQGVNVLQAGKKSVRDFRPSARLYDTYDIFLERKKDADAFGIASHAERLTASKCFQASDGKLVCTTCHDPHKSIALTDTMIYVNQCMSCHQEEGCKEPEANRLTVQNNCITCHMPSGGTSDIPHVSFHDHKIRVVKDPTAQDIQETKAFVDKLYLSNRPKATPDNWGKALLQYYERNQPQPQYLDLALSRLTPKSPYAQARAHYHKQQYTQAQTAIEKALAQDPKEPYRLFVQAQIHEAQNKHTEAYNIYNDLYQTQPEMTEAGIRSVITLLKTNGNKQQLITQAQSRLQKLYAQKPFDKRILTNLGFLELNKGNIPLAQQYLTQALSYDPQYPKALENLVYLHLTKRDKQTANTYLQRLVKHHPNHPSIGRLQQMLR